ncbi:hypothetical protein BpHYR1_010296 [Brachionus plicatilis]|uniref:Uncharacterized protein n=1 Tax=Brachionus plicatilis TaxID=10195 RepID=A0A3M7QR95_BRAPC|nr:hypothetical protein BpHYR1_010296 [Brachionus plicatilis]
MISRQLKNASNQARSNYEMTIIDKCKNKPKRINRDRVMSLKDDMDNLVTDKLPLANILNTELRSAFRIDDESIIPELE